MATASCDLHSQRRVGPSDDNSMLATPDSALCLACALHDRPDVCLKRSDHSDLLFVCPSPQCDNSGKHCDCALHRHIEVLQPAEDVRLAGAVYSRAVFSKDKSNRTGLKKWCKLSLHDDKLKSMNTTLEEALAHVQQHDSDKENVPPPPCMGHLLSDPQTPCGTGLPAVRRTGDIGCNEHICPPCWDMYKKQLHHQSHMMGVNDHGVINQLQFALGTMLVADLIHMVWPAGKFEELNSFHHTDQKIRGLDSQRRLGQAHSFDTKAQYTSPYPEYQGGTVTSCHKEIAAAALAEFRKLEKTEGALCKQINSRRQQHTIEELMLMMFQRRVVNFPIANVFEVFGGNVRAGRTW